ncbi:MAG: hypothetical protein KDA84_15470, partial [Planctomycetaceae bacterium]|nr:hypothetical protein [Planctomycetaceae bacterium]
MNLDPKQTHVIAEWKHKAPLITCRYDPKGRFLFSCAEDYSIQRWDLATGKPTVWEAHDSWVRDFAFLNDGETLVSAGSDDQFIFWSVTAEKPTPMKSVKAHAGWIRSIAVSPDGKQFATGGNDLLVKIWNSDGGLVRELAGHEKHVYSVRYHPSGEFLLSGDLGGQVHQWDVKSGKLVRTFDAKDLYSYNKGQQVDYGGVRDLAFSPDGKSLACCGLYKATNPLGAVNEPLIVVFDWNTAKKTRSHIANGVRGVAWRVVYLSNGFLATGSGGSGGGYLVFWKPDSDKEFHKLKLKQTLRGMDISPDGLKLAAAHSDGYLRISQMTAKPA